MIYPERSAIAWSHKYGIPVTSKKCRGCGQEVLVDVPVIAREFVGFESSIHQCGTKFKISYLKPRSLEFAALESEEVLNFF